MNDFTKAELLDLMSMMVDWHEKDYVSQITNDPLLDKIHSMIDNYFCKIHESDGQVYIQQDADMSARTECFKCKKCGDLYR